MSFMLSEHTAILPPFQDPKTGEDSSIVVVAAAAVIPTVLIIVVVIVAFMITVCVRSVCECT